MDVVRASSTWLEDAALIGCASYLASLRLSPLVSPHLSRTYCDLPSQKQLQWDSRFPSTLHAAIITGSTCYLFFFSDIFSDLKYGGLDMGAHHVAALASVALAGLSSQGHNYTLALLATECTTPFVNARWFLDAAGLREARVYVINGVALLCAWFVGRILLFLAFFQHVYRHAYQIPLVTWPARVLLLGVPALLFTLNILWFKKILRGAAKILIEPRSPAPLLKSPRTPARLVPSPPITLVPNSVKAFQIDRKIS
ncbi:hypothetical protein QBZ16_005476 [Prototheca wickerhamii]|uniref:TLC domain-containing protein n=1 Tax=Prototheca wickerhamii TaxID=3111 RepID=A0AAD9IEB7_PROWI|nr:hypothetical protein QBZ16_005476 [Prototheca wickerhamii]